MLIKYVHIIKSLLTKTFYSMSFKNKFMNFFDYRTGSGHVERSGNKDK